MKRTLAIIASCLFVLLVVLGGFYVRKEFNLTPSESEILGFIAFIIIIIPLAYATFNLLKFIEEEL